MTKNPQFPQAADRPRKLRKGGQSMRTDESAASSWSVSQQLDELAERIESLDDSVQQLLTAFLDKPHVKDAYTTKEVAEMLGKKPFTVREWARLRRVNAYKAACGRGADDEWRISHEELVRIQNEGLLPIPEHY